MDVSAVLNLVENYEAGNNNWLIAFKDIHKLCEILLQEVILKPNCSKKAKSNAVSICKLISTEGWINQGVTNDEPGKIIITMLLQDILFKEYTSKSDKQLVKDVLTVVYEKKVAEAWVCDMFYNYLFELKSEHNHIDSYVFDCLSLCIKFIHDDEDDLIDICKDNLEKFLEPCINLLEHLLSEQIVRSSPELTYSLITFLSDYVSVDFSADLDNKFVEIYEITKYFLERKYSDTNMLPLIVETLKLWSALLKRYNERIEEKLNEMHDFILKYVANIPPSGLIYDEIYKQISELINKIYVTSWEKVQLNEEKFLKTFEILHKGLQGVNLDYNMETSYEYACKIVDDNYFHMIKKHSTSVRMNAFLCWTADLVGLCGSIASWALHVFNDHFQHHCKCLTEGTLNEIHLMWNFVRCVDLDYGSEIYEWKKNKLNLEMNLNDLYNMAFNIINNSTEHHPIIVCDVIKFINGFKKYFPVDKLMECLDPLIQLLSPQNPYHQRHHDDQVNHQGHHLSVITVAAFALKEMLEQKYEETDGPIIPEEYLKERSTMLIHHLISSLQLHGNSHNEHVIAALETTLSCLNQCDLLHNEQLVTFLTNEIKNTNETPDVSTKYVDCVHECVGQLCLMSVNLCGKQEGGGDLVNRFEEIFMPIFQQVLLQRPHKYPMIFISGILLDVLIPHHLKLITPPTIPSKHGELISSILTSPLWLDEKCSSHLMSFVLSFVLKNSQLLIAKYDGYILDLYSLADKFQCSILNAYRSIQLYMVLKEITKPPFSEHQQILKKVVKLVQSNKNRKLLIGFTVYICSLVNEYSAEEVLQYFEDHKKSFFESEVFEEIIMKVGTYMSMNDDRSICVVGLTSLLKSYTSHVLQDPTKFKLWIRMLFTLVDMSKETHWDVVLQKFSAPTFDRVEWENLKCMYRHSRRRHDEDDEDEVMYRSLYPDIQLQKFVVDALRGTFVQHPEFLTSPLYNDDDVIKDIGERTKLNLKKFVRSMELLGCDGVPHLVTCPVDEEDSDDEEEAEEGSYEEVDGCTGDAAA